MCVQVRCIEINKVFKNIKATAERCGVNHNIFSIALKSKSHQSGKHPESGIKLHWEKLDGVGKEG